MSYSFFVCSDRPLLYMSFVLFYFFNDTATTEIYTYLHTLSLHDVLPIFVSSSKPAVASIAPSAKRRCAAWPTSVKKRGSAAASVSRSPPSSVSAPPAQRQSPAIRDRFSGTAPIFPSASDRKSTRLNSSH